MKIKMKSWVTPKFGENREILGFVDRITLNGKECWLIVTPNKNPRKKYFRILNGNYITATKSCRISFFAPKYFKVSKNDLVLNNAEKKDLMKILSTVVDFDGIRMTMFQKTLCQFNFERFDLAPFMTAEKRKKIGLKFDLPMPDYMNLPE